MTGPGSPLTTWQALAVAADEGQLYLNPDAARKCFSACDAYLEKLAESQGKAKELASVDGWGEFRAGQDLRAMFRAKAAGGENNMVDVLQSHIDVVEEMKVVFQKFFVATDATDSANAADVGIHGPR